MYRIVPFVKAHVEPFTADFNALPGNDVWTAPWVRRKTVAEASYDPGLMLTAMAGDEPVGYILAVVDEETVRVFAFLVRPAYQRQGIGRALFEQVEAAARERGLTTVEVGWWLRFFLPGVDLRYTDAFVFLERLGYVTRRETRVNLDVQIAGQDFDTTEKERELAAKGYDIHRATPADRPGMAALCEAENHLNWIAETAWSMENDPPTVHVATKDGRVVGFAAHGAIGPSHFGPMLTASELRGKGMGSVLLKRCLADWQRDGLEKGEIIWAGPISFYARVVGATIGKVFWAFEKALV